MLTFNLEKEPFVLTDVDDMDSLLCLIHDEHFELADLKYSKEDGLVTIPYRRIFHGRSRRLIRNWFIWKTYEIDVIRAALTIKNVKSLEIDDRSKIGTYSFNTMSYEDEVLRIICCEDCEIRIAASQLEIESREIEVRGKAQVSFFFFLCECSSGKVWE
jgi:hypothetical protein